MINETTLGLKTLMLFGAPPADFVPATAPATTGYGAIYAFGDSLTDVGNVFIQSGGALPTSQIYSDGRFTNGNVWVQDLANDFKLPAVKASLAGGTDFAYGGAEAGPEPLGTAGADINLPAQLAQFLAAHPAPSHTALYALSIGANDLFNAMPEYSTNPSAVVSDIQTAVNDETSFIAGLAARGAHNFVILNVPNLGLTPAASGSSVATQLSALYDHLLATAISGLAAEDNLNIQIINTFQMIDEVVAHPASYGFTNVTEPVWTGNLTNPASGTLNATGAAQNSYLFFDSRHPTAAGHTDIANLAFNQLR